MENQTITEAGITSNFKLYKNNNECRKCYNIRKCSRQTSSKSGSKDTFFKTTIHIGVFKIWKCKQCDSFLQPSFVNRIPCIMECATQLPTMYYITHATLYCHQLISNNIDKDYNCAAGDLSTLVTGWSDNCTHQLLTSSLHEMTANRINSNWNQI